MGYPLSKFYGGLLTENEIQATCRDLLRDGRVACNKAGLTILWDVYDELVGLAREDEAADVAKEMDRLMCNSSPWIGDCPISCEYHIVDHYMK